VEEHLDHNQGVTGSKPVSPIRKNPRFSGLINHPNLVSIGGEFVVAAGIKLQSGVIKLKFFINKFHEE
jgi:hypothetical protein